MAKESVTQAGSGVSESQAVSKETGRQTDRRTVREETAVRCP